MDTKRPKRPVESKPGSIFHTASGNSLTDSKGIDLSYSCLAPGGVGNTNHSLKAQYGGRSRNTGRGASNEHFQGT